MDQEFSFGEWIRKRRKTLDLTQEALAERVGYSAEMLRKIEYDERRPSQRGAALLAQALKIPEDQQEAFLKIARQERTIDRLGPVDQEEPFPWQTTSQPRTNVPLPVTLLVGRQAEIVSLTDLIQDSACRLITLVGLAGIGKTRLAVQVARSQLDQFAHGVFFVSLAPLDSPEMIVATIAKAIGFQFHGSSETEEQLIRYLQGKRMLLVLDNFEHLTAGVSLIPRIIQFAPGIQLLVTSRERLNLQGEWVFEVDGLPYPMSPDESRSDRVEAFEAVHLFLQSALRANPGFSLNEKHRMGIVRICQLMEGMPLGIELAAAWVRVLSCQEIASEIESNLDFLKASARDFPERHKSLRAALDHSWNLLSTREKEVFKRLSVFRGGFRRESAEEVASASLEEITSLLDKSLLKRVGEQRYDLHELVRQYAAAHLASEAQEHAQTQDRHSRYYVSLLEQWGEGIRGPRQMEILAEMDTEMDNVRLAGRWMTAHPRLGEIRKSLESLRNYYEVRGRFREGAELFHEAVASLETEDETDAEHADEHAVVLGQLLVREGYFQVRQDHYEEAAELLQRSLALLRPSSDHAALADTLAVLAYMHSRLGEFAEARQFAEESLGLNQAVGNQIGKAFCLRTLANNCLALGAYEEAYAFSNESLSICRDLLGDPHGTAICLTTLSAAARHLGKYDEARQWAEEGVRVSKALKDRWCLAQTLRQLGLVYLELGELGQAEELIRESIAHTRETGDRMLLASALIALGRAERAAGALARSKEHFLQALQTAMETKTIIVALQALAETAVSAMNEAENERALELITYGLQHPSVNVRLKADLDKVRTELEARLTLQQIAEIEKRAAARPFDSVLEELLAESKEV
jgi:predicted ATPase/DNA-binding XRE family transcriptional regulator